jgi:heme/copper-type cytochrome/quinol oxidase subunit 1
MSIVNRRNAVLGWVTWLTTTDHKKIGIMYLVNSYFFFGVAGLLAVFIRAELAEPGRWGTTFTLIQSWGILRG